MINLVTSVSRPHNLKRIYKSIVQSLNRSSLKAKWILIMDGPNVITTDVAEVLKKSPFQIDQIIHRGGPSPYGIVQKNAGMASISDGYYHCIDDDNIVHPDFFPGLERAIRANPKKRAFVFGQKRWDNVRSLVAAPDRMEYGKIDNTMFVVHMSLIGEKRYDLSKSGREDYLFFRNLFDLHGSEFVFLPETLAYYNFISHFPTETADELKVFPAQADRPSAAPPAELLAAAQAVGVLKIALYSSKRDRCGISTYTEHLAESLTLLGHDVRYFSSRPPYEKAFEEILDWRPDVFHVQHETAIMPPEPIFERYLGFIAAQGARIMFTLHTATQAAAQLASRVSGGRKSIITHRASDEAKGAIVIPMPCTNMGSHPGRALLRRVFGFPEEAFVVSTVGFMIPWKNHEQIAESLTPWLLRHPNVHLQVIASEHYNESLSGYAKDCRARLQRLSERFPGRVRHVDEYPSDLELVERLAASDLGYVWCPFETASSSAAAAQFVTAKCPLVASSSGHYDGLGDGVIRGPRDSISAFAKLIEETASNEERLATLRAGQWATYKNRNYLMTALKHIEIYERKDL